MKNKILQTALLATGLCLSLTACHDLDMSPLSSGSNENWYSTIDELRMAVNIGYNNDYLLVDGEMGESNNDWSDDSHFRQTTDAFQNGTLNSRDWRVERRWKNNYFVISKMNAVINKYQRAIDNGALESQVKELVGEAYFFRGRAYGELVFHWGDVPYYTDDIDIDDALKMGRTPKAEVLQHVYEDLDKAAELLPVKQAGEQRVTKGAALAFKARYALYMGDYQTAAKAAKAVMDLGVYSLEPDYSTLFLPTTQQSSEYIFIVSRSVTNNLNIIPSSQISNVIPRNNGGFICRDPTWDLLASYTCTDGLPIDESPLFDPHNPFKNRDPRCAKTIAAFGEELLDYIYDPSPAALETKQVSSGKMVYNNDTRSNKFYASFNGLCWRKYVGQKWLDDGKKGENPKILMRYADVLLMYAEAKIELNQIDQSVIDAMNQVRARAYGVAPTATTSYPAITIQSQAKMRYELRVERRMELAYENLRYADIIRWKIAPIVYNRKIYMLLDPEAEKKLYEAGNWFWGITPDIDENGLPDFTKLEAAGLCAPAAERHWNDRQYLWPIPDTELEINPNMKQNDGY